MHKKIKWVALLVSLTLGTASALAAPVISQNTDALALANAITGGSVTVLSATYQGSSVQAGTFLQGQSSVGFASGIVLSTGNVSSIPGPNANTGIEAVGVAGCGTQCGQISTDAGANGSALMGANSQDAAVLTIRFQFGDGSVGGDVGVRYVFASEEYLNYVNSQFNDAFAFFLDGQNIALLPGTSQAVAINSVNPGANPSLYINNVNNNAGIPVANRDFQFDGLTQVLTASKTNLSAGVHTMTFVVTDIADRLLDSAVFLQAGSFSTETKPPSDVPEPGSLLLVGLALVGLAGASRRRAA